MAQLTKGPFGTVQGKLGQMAFRERNGKNIIAMRPKKPYTPPQDQGSIDRRSRFKFSAKLAQSIISIPELTAVWQPVTPSGMSAFNYIIQKNDPLVNPGSVSDMTTITPDMGFEFDCTAQSIPLVLTGSIAPSVPLAALGTETGIDVSKEPNIKFAYVIAMGNPSTESLPAFWFIGGVTAAQPTVLNTAMAFNIPIVGSNAVSIKSYGNRTILFALVTLDSQSVPVKYSGTLQRSLQTQD